MVQWDWRQKLSQTSALECEAHWSEGWALRKPASCRSQCKLKAISWTYIYKLNL